MEPDELTSEDLAAFEAMREADAVPPDSAPDADALIDAGDDVTAPAAADTAEPPEGGQQTLVPLAVLREERARRQAGEKAAAEERQRYEARVGQMLELLQRQQAPPAGQPAAPAAPTIPAIEQDPVGHIVGQLQQTRGDLERIQQAEAQRMQMAQQQQVIAAITQDAQSAEAQFRQTKPDYDAAVAHLVAGRNRELEISGMTDPAHRQQFLSQEALGIAIRARQMGRSPAEIIYELATQRGYSSAPPAPAAPPALSAAAQVAQINAGQQQARTLGAAAGAAPAAINANTVLAMDDNAFSKWLTTASRAQKEAVFGA